MPVRTLDTRQFSEPALYVAFGAIALVAAAGIGSFFTSRTLLNTRASAAVNQTATLEPVTLEPGLGALRVDVKALLDRNEWAVFEIQALDADGNVVAAVVKGAWDESVSRRDADLQAGLDMQASQSRQLTLAIKVLEHGNVRTGQTPQTMADPVSFRIEVKSGVIDSRFLWGGFYIALLFAIAAWFLVRTSGKRVFVADIRDSDVGDRATLGGDKQLIRAEVEILADETSPKQLTAELYVEDSEGKQLHRASQSVPLKFIYEDGDLDRTIGKAVFYLSIAPRDRYHLYTEIHPDAPVDRTQLTVTEGIRTRGNVTVTFIDG